MFGIQIRPSKLIEGSGVAVFLVITSLTIFMVTLQPTMSVNGVYWQDWRMTEFGPLGPADIDILIKVRQAGLWEIPVSQQAQDRARTQVVKDVGQRLAADHIELDRRTVDVAAQLDVDLPSQPNPAQQRNMEVLTDLEGEEYDYEFANRLRKAHGGVFESLAEVRAGTRNDLIRSFASHGTVVVLRHMNHLESTGLVDHEDLNQPVDPNRRPQRPAPDYE